MSDYKKLYIFLLQSKNIKNFRDFRFLVTIIFFRIFLSRSVHPFPSTKSVSNSNQVAIYGSTEPFKPWESCNALWANVFFQNNIKPLYSFSPWIWSTFFFLIILKSCPKPVTGVSKRSLFNPFYVWESLVTLKLCLFIKP